MNIPQSIKTVRDALILLLWGAFTLWIASAGQLSTYLHPSLQRFTIAGGVMLLFLAYFAFRGVFNKSVSNASHHCCHHDHAQEHRVHPHPHADGGCCHHDHAHDGEGHQHGDDEEHSHEGHAHGDEPVSVSSFLFKTVILLIPLVVILLGQGTRFSITTVQNRGVVDNLDKLPAAKASQAVAQTPVGTPRASTDGSSDASPSSSGAMPIQVIDLLYAVQMPSYRSEFEGKQVELIGQYVPLSTSNPKGDRFQAIRMFITCCAADAKPVGVTIQYPRPLNLSEMGWVKIIGTPTFPMEGGRRTAILEATKVEECPAPAEPFVY
jgi:uncharacterized repeat protein (TIGR03943 family)